jgi:hypothetical protein
LLWAVANYRFGSEKNGVIESDGNTSWKAPAVLLLATFLLSLLVYLTYNLTFVQHQGRYLFSALIPISIGFALGWAAIARPLIRRWPSIVIFLPLGLVMALIMLDLLALFRFIIPSLT